MALPSASRFPAPRGLYAITPDGLPAAELFARAEAALAGGTRLLQYRDKLAEPAERRPVAEALAAACVRHGAALIINDDAELALAVGAPGVHLGKDDGDLAAARRRLGPGLLIGASCYADPARAAAAAPHVDYLAFGAVFPSSVKPGAVAAPLALLGAAKAAHGLPICAIGGITLANAPRVIAAGADWLAVITDLFSAPDIAERAAAYGRLFAEAGASAEPLL
ncbi:thiamine phosphate synthase [Oryzomicrobium sp.]|uniref:thiamine phosphate synthase n=1 Tax=Oryzomicrobium sp. TaxID=1911578 RepID=UPI0025EAA04B|nr:thiamine phosphate synthase [Oryzomicrobium sp.]MCE1243021.1 thiamine phosphate synthase [Oryzomicrobium sp.]